MYNPLITYKGIYTGVILYNFAAVITEKAVNNCFCYDERAPNLSSSH